MQVLKKNFTSIGPTNSNEFIEDKITYAGLPKETRLIRIRYIGCEETQTGKKSSIKTKEVVLGRMNVPAGLSMANAVKTVSYVFDQVTKKVKSAKNNYLLASQLTNHCLLQYHFSEIEDDTRKKEKCLNLYFVGGNAKLLPYTKQYADYIDWYVPEVPREELKAAYSDVGLTLPRTTKINFETESEPGEE